MALFAWADGPRQGDDRHTSLAEDKCAEVEADFLGKRDFRWLLSSSGRSAFSKAVFSWELRILCPA